MKKQKTHEELLEERRNEFKKIYKNTFGEELKVLSEKEKSELHCIMTFNYYGIEEGKE